LIKSPCIDKCEIDIRNGFCIGCYRNEHEIFNWLYFTEQEKEKILSEIKKRNKIKK
jgi:predicted Fe-S protein YdhL (DUF1289 family)